MNFKLVVPIIALGFLLIFTGIAKSQVSQTVSNGQTMPDIDFSALGECVFNWTNNNPAIGLPASGTGNIPSFTAINNGTTPITATINVSPINKGFAYFANSSGNSVAAVNTLTNTISTDIPVGKMPGIMTISRDQSRLYIINGGDSTISVIDTKTNTVINTINIPAPKPQSTYSSIKVTPDGSTLLVSKGSFIYALDAVTGQILNKADKITHIDDISLSLDGTTLFVAGGFDIGIYDVKSLLASQPRIPSYPGYTFSAIRLQVSKDGTKVYILNDRVNQPITIWVLDIQGLQPIQVIALDGLLGSGEMVQSADGRYLYLNMLDKNTLASNISVVDMKNYYTVTNIPLPYFVTGMSIAPSGNLLYVAGRSAIVTIVDTRLNAVRGVIGLSNIAGSIGDFVTGNCESFSYTITIYPNPIINTNGNLPVLSTVYGRPSASGSFTVSGNYISGNIVATPPIGFEISRDNITFSRTITVAPDNTGVINNASLFIRLAKTTPVSTYMGIVTLTSVNTTVSLVQPISAVNPAPLVITVDNKTQFYGLGVPKLTATYKGFVNNDTLSQLVASPNFFTTATVGSAVGQYPIIANGAVSPNYTFSYYPGILTIIPLSALTIPNTFTPNGDGINDTWNINLINNYPNFTVQIFNRYGQRVYYSHNYSNAWDGTYQNSPLPFGVYYYLIALGPTNLSGYVTIVR